MNSLVASGYLLILGFLRLKWHRSPMLSSSSSSSALRPVHVSTHSGNTCTVVTSVNPEAQNANGYIRQLNHWQTHGATTFCCSKCCHFFHIILFYSNPHMANVKITASLFLWPKKGLGMPTANMGPPKKSSHRILQEPDCPGPLRHTDWPEAWVWAHLPEASQGQGLDLWLVATYPPQPLTYTPSRNKGLIRPYLLRETNGE